MICGFPDQVIQIQEANKVGLVCDKGSIIDRSIQDGYINAIRRAKNFIYIENQYFLGSSYAWNPDEDIDALHIIPKELSQKIISKIEARERFSVYVVIPMWPEGEPESAAGQAILYWQSRTMEMMYTEIANAIQRMDLNAHPKDYLSFFCLGNRELLMNSGEDEPIEKPLPDSDYSKAQHNRRFMIYVHAKMMIVDDEYIIIGWGTRHRDSDGGLSATSFISQDAGKGAGANAQNDSVNASPQVSVPGKPVVAGTNLNIGMDLWNSSATGRVKLRPGTGVASGVAQAMVGREGLMPDNQWIQIRRLILLEQSGHAHALLLITKRNIPLMQLIAPHLVIASLD